MNAQGPAQVPSLDDLYNQRDAVPVRFTSVGGELCSLCANTTCSGTGVW